MKNIIINSSSSTSANVLIRVHVGLTCCRYQYQCAQVKEIGFEPSWNAMWDMCVSRVPTNQYFFYGFVFFYVLIKSDCAAFHDRPICMQHNQNVNRHENPRHTNMHHNARKRSPRCYRYLGEKFFKSVCSTGESYTFINRLLAKNYLKQ